MKNKILKRSIAVVLSLLLVFAVTACGGNPSDDGSDVNTINVTLSITYPKDAKKDNVKEFAMNVEENATVLQILESYCNQENIPVDVESSGTTYVTSINGIKAKGSSGWVYEVNDDASITKAVDEYKVKDGDKVVWKFVTF